MLWGCELRKSLTMVCSGGLCHSCTEPFSSSVSQLYPWQECEQVRLEVGTLLLGKIEHYIRCFSFSGRSKPGTPINKNIFGGGGDVYVCIEVRSSLSYMGNRYSRRRVLTQRREIWSFRGGDHTHRCLMDWEDKQLGKHTDVSEEPTASILM
jgi:hypothetical protein